MDFGARCIPIEELDALTICGGPLGPGLELVDLIRLVGERQCPRLLEVAVDAVLAREGDQTVQVLDALPFEDVELVRKVADPVRGAVGEARLAEAAVTAAGTVGDGR